MMRGYLVAAAVTIAGAAGFITVLGLHGVLLYGLGNYLQWPTAIIIGILFLAFVMHLGLLAPLAARFRKWKRGE
jgi:hypothetical protein